jgi:hypothetical protein
MPTTPAAKQTAVHTQAKTASAKAAQSDDSDSSSEPAMPTTPAAKQAAVHTQAPQKKVAPSKDSDSSESEPPMPVTPAAKRKAASSQAKAAASDDSDSSESEPSNSVEPAAKRESASSQAQVAGTKAAPADASDSSESEIPQTRTTPARPAAKKKAACSQESSSEEEDQTTKAPAPSQVAASGNPAAESDSSKTVKAAAKKAPKSKPDLPEAPVTNHSDSQSSSSMAFKFTAATDPIKAAAVTDEAGSSDKAPELLGTKRPRAVPQDASDGDDSLMHPAKLQATRSTAREDGEVAESDPASRGVLDMNILAELLQANITGDFATVVALADKISARANVARQKSLEPDLPGAHSVHSESPQRRPSAAKSSAKTPDANRKDAEPPSQTEASCEPTGEFGSPKSPVAAAKTQGTSSSHASASGSRLYNVTVKSLPWVLDLDALRKHLGACGEILDLNLPTQSNGIGRRTKGYCEVSYKTKEGFENALKYDGTEYCGRKIYVQKNNEIKPDSHVNGDDTNGLDHGTPDSSKGRGNDPDEVGTPEKTTKRKAKVGRGSEATKVPSAREEEEEAETVSVKRPKRKDQSKKATGVI